MAERIIMAEREKKRGVLLTAWLVLMLLTNGISAGYYLLFGSFVTAALPTIPSWALYLLGVLSIINVVFTVFLFKWKKWAFFGFCAMAGFVFVLNIFLGFGLVSISGLFGPIILYLILRSKWNYLE